VSRGGAGPVQSSTGRLARWDRGGSGADELQQEFCFSAQSETSLEGSHVSGQEGIQLTSKLEIKQTLRILQQH
jgi:hypothetical protein